MNSPVEILLGKRREAWGRRERWTVRCFLAAAAFLAAILPHTLTPSGARLPWALTLMWAVLFAAGVVVLARRKLSSPSGSESPGQ